MPADDQIEEAGGLLGGEPVVAHSGRNDSTSLYLHIGGVHFRVLPEMAPPRGARGQLAVQGRDQRLLHRGR